jgi:hypothetical protein
MKWIEINRNEQFIRLDIEKKRNHYLEFSRQRSFNACWLCSDLMRQNPTISRETVFIKIINPFMKRLISSS